MATWRSKIEIFKNVQKGVFGVFEAEKFRKNGVGSSGGVFLGDFEEGVKIDQNPKKPKIAISRPRKNGLAEVQI